MKDPIPIWGTKTVLRLHCDPVVAYCCVGCQEHVIPAVHTIAVRCEAVHITPGLLQLLSAAHHTRNAYIGCQLGHAACSAAQVQLCMPLQNDSMAVQTGSATRPHSECITSTCLHMVNLMSILALMIQELLGAGANRMTSCDLMSLLYCLA